MEGSLYIISAASGTGKSSLIAALLAQSHYPVQVSISHTTRQPRANEKNGVHYHFITEEKFKQHIEEQAFLEYAQVFGHYYGTSLTILQNTLQQGIDVLLDIDWQGALQVRAKIPNTKSIFLLPPSLQELKRRLVDRAQDSQQVIDARMLKAMNEIRHYHEYDYLIINDQFDVALQNLQHILYSERLTTQKQIRQHQLLINQLLEKQTAI